MLGRLAILPILNAGLCLALLLPSASRARVVTEIADAAGDGAGSTLAGAIDVATDSSGNVFVIGSGTHNVLRIAAPAACSTSGTPCSITEIMDATGDGAGNGVSVPESIAVDPVGNVYVASSGSSSVHRIATPDACSTDGTPCAITQIIDASGDGAGNPLTAAKGLAVDADGNVFVGGRDSANAFKITTPDSCSTNGTPCTITQIIWFHGAPGGGNRLDGTNDIAVDSAGNVYVAASVGANAFKIVTPGTCSTTGTLCTITEIIDDTGDGAGNALAGETRITVDFDGNVYVSGRDSDNVFKIDTPGSCDTNGTPCTVAEIIDSTGDAAGNTLDGALGLSTDAEGNVYVAGESTSNVFRIESPGSCGTVGAPCAITQIVDSSGDGAGNTLDTAMDLAIASGTNFYVAAQGSNNVFKIGESSGAGALAVPALGWSGRVLLAVLFVTATLCVAPMRARSS